jgi:hypothetical protein
VSTTEELLDKKVTAPDYKTENTAVGIRHSQQMSPLSAKVGNHFADKLFFFISLHANASSFKVILMTFPW